MDRRPRPDGAGGLTTRLPETWEECHEVLCELEGVKAGSKAFTAARAAGQYQEDATGTFGKKGKDKGTGKGKEGDQNGKPQGGKKGPCVEWRDKGTCKFGDNCR